MLVRAVFVIEPTGERISCALNPSQLVFRRTTGFVPRRSLAGAFTSSRTADDDTLLFTGGGVTELVLDLLFDVSLPGSTVAATDVSSLTSPLWDLAQEASFESGYRKPSPVRFIWGKAWNFLAVITAASQRFEHFTNEGVARRAWLRLRLVRVPDLLPPDGAGVVPIGEPGEDLLAPPAALPEGGDDTEPELISGPDDDDDGPARRLDVLAFLYGDGAGAWRELAAANGIDDPLSVPWDQPLSMPADGGTGGSDA